MTNTINGKTYIGQSVNIERRLQQYRTSLTGNRIIDKAIRKYGWVNFKFEVVHVCHELNESELNLLELRYIRENTSDYNVTHTKRNTKNPVANSGSSDHLTKGKTVKKNHDSDILKKWRKELGRLRIQKSAFIRNNCDRVGMDWIEYKVLKWEELGHLGEVELDERMREIEEHVFDPNLSPLDNLRVVFREKITPRYHNI